MQKYGIPHSNTPESVRKSRATFLERYSTEEDKKIIIDKTKATFLRKYGTENINNTEWKKEKSRRTCMEKYGVNSITKTELFKTKVSQAWEIRQKAAKENLEKQYNKKFYAAKELPAILNKKMPGDIIRTVKTFDLPLYKINQMNFIDENTLSILKDIYNSSRSKGEQQVGKILEKYKINYIYQKTFEDCKYIGLLRFDFYLPEYNIAIEYQGAQHFTFSPFISSTSRKNKTARMKYTSEMFEEVKKRDEIKVRYCKDNNILLLTPTYENSIKEIEDMIVSAISNYINNDDTEKRDSI